MDAAASSAACAARVDELIDRLLRNDDAALDDRLLDLRRAASSSYESTGVSAAGNELDARRGREAEG